MNTFVTTLEKLLISSVTFVWNLSPLLVTAKIYIKLLSFVNNYTQTVNKLLYLLTHIKTIFIYIYSKKYLYLTLLI